MSMWTFLLRYEPTEERGVYLAKGYCRATRNPFGVPVEIEASWGSPQVGGEHCMVADVCDARGEHMEGEPYLIDGKVFLDTYTQVSE